MFYRSGILPLSIEGGLKSAYRGDLIAETMTSQCDNVQFFDEDFSCGYQAPLLSE